VKTLAALTAVFAIGLGLPLATAAQAPPQPQAQPVLAPHHGDVLFHHFQGRWVAALGA
jgi:hypothetical protein